MKKLLKWGILALCLPMLFTQCKKDPCDGIVCQNGGECLNGLCSCPDGYEGPACEQKKTPTKIIIPEHSIKVTNYPVENSNGDFDDGSYPDIYFVLAYEGGEEIFNSNWTYFQDCNGLDLDFWHPAIEVDIENDYQELWLYLYDEDSNEDGNDDFVDLVLVTLDFNENGFFRKYNNNLPDGTQVFFDVEYQF